ncbi:MAG: SbcC/MukB-like Walker B domain-containing protein, partial [Microbacterium sp.]
DAARGAFATVADRIADADRRRALAVTLSDAHAEAVVRDAAARDAVTARDARVAASVFSDAADATDALRDSAVRTALDERIREHDAALRAERDRLRDLELELAGAPEELVDLAATATALAEARERWSTTVDAAAHAAQTAARLRDLLDRAMQAHAKIADLADEHAVVSRLANTVAGKAPNTHRMTLESFVLAAELEEIVEAANLRLDDMSSGRYRLQHSDARAARGAASGLGLQIMDAHTGQARPAQSLSGGETFLASLALALGLAEVVTARAGGVKLDTLFIDEGFGSLDDDTLDLAMRTLDELRQGGRTVGLISHVAAMKEQLPAQLVVEATPQGPSVIRQDAVVAV